MKNAYNVIALCYTGWQRVKRSVGKVAGKIFFRSSRSDFAESERISLVKGSWKIVYTNKQLDWIPMGLGDEQMQAHLRKTDPNAIVKDGIVVTYRGKTWLSS